MVLSSLISRHHKSIDVHRCLNGIDWPGLSYRLIPSPGACSARAVRIVTGFSADVGCSALVAPKRPWSLSF